VGAPSLVGYRSGTDEAPPARERWPGRRAYRPPRLSPAPGRAPAGIADASGPWAQTPAARGRGRRRTV